MNALWPGRVRFVPVTRDFVVLLFLSLLVHKRSNILALKKCAKKDGKYEEVVNMREFNIAVLEI